ncbi:prepilin peptidase [Thalassococcus sp. BH17M4-6]|uniref:prepilin peptidase n=1 Tax=Thalassococcus sp. BH17M4-6 TaxID=3413148 RepID=UPI003BE2ED3F
MSLADMALSLALAGVLAALAIVDLRQKRLPDALTLPLIAAGLVFAWAEGRLADGLIGAALGYGVFWLIGELHFRRHGTEGLGLGDAKLFAAAGAWLGWAALPFVLLIAAMGGLGAAALRGTGRGTALAFGPWLALGFAVVWVATRLGLF